MLIFSLSVILTFCSVFIFYLVNRSDVQLILVYSIILLITHYFSLYVSSQLLFYVIAPLKHYLLCCDTGALEM